MMDQNNGGAKVCGCGHHKLVSWLIVLFGLVFLLGTFGYLSAYTVNIVWPIIVIVLGFMKMCKCCSHCMLK